VPATTTHHAPSETRSGERRPKDDKQPQAAKPPDKKEKKVKGTNTAAKQSKENKAK
jgi:hypothetical protein